MKLKLQYFIFIMLLLQSYRGNTQNVSLYDQENGHCDFVFIGNTLNTEENGLSANCSILTSSSAMLNLNPGDSVLKAYLYWAGSGTGDFDVTLNGQDIAADRTFGVIQTTSQLPFFSAFADVTTLVQANGAGNYTLSNLDLTAVIPAYCPNGGNFGGWAIVVVLENAALPINQINVYDGLQSVPNLLQITLTNLNVIDNVGSKIAFVAWEGDAFISVNESLTINGLVLSNPLNPANNAFNGTNSFTGATNLYNMDLDVYDLQGFIAVGDQTANIQLTSGQDFVMINTVVTKFNSTLPDATVEANNVEVACNTRDVVVNYTVFNTNGTNTLPAGVRIAFYINGQFVQLGQTTTAIISGGSENGQVILSVPNSIPDNFNVQIVVDDNGSGQGGILELDETNNSSNVVPVQFLAVPDFNPLAEVNSCNEGLGKGTYDFSSYENLVKTNQNDTVTFYENQADAENEIHAIGSPNHYTAASSPTEIFVRIENSLGCYAVTSFFLVSKNCPPTVYNYVSANNDGYNDDFYIKGLRDVFLNFKLSIYNRWGRLIWIGDNNSPNWTGANNKGFTPNTGTTPDGTYFYILELNDPDYPDTLRGFVYFKR